MKRSEVITHIANLLDKLSIHDGLDANSEAAHILAELESMGIQPPAVKEPCETFVLFQGQYHKTEDSFHFVHKWDEE